MQQVGRARTVCKPSIYNSELTLLAETSEPAVASNTKSKSTAAKSSEESASMAIDSDQDDPDYTLPKRRRPNLSEEEDDDFTMADAEQPATPVVRLFFRGYFCILIVLRILASARFLLPRAALLLPCVLFSISC